MLNEILDIYSPEDLQAVIKMIIDFLLLTVGAGVGVFARMLVLDYGKNMKEFFGFILLTGMIAFSASAILKILSEGNNVAPEGLFVTTLILGFFLPAFKNWFKDKKFFKLIAKVANKTKSIESAIVETIEEEEGKSWPQIERRKKQEDKKKFIERRKDEDDFDY